MQGYYLAPTLVEGLPHSSRSVQEEVFGPMVTLHRFSDEDEAVALANDTRYGLAASVWSQDISRVHRVASRIQVRSVVVFFWSDLLCSKLVGRSQVWSSMAYLSLHWAWLGWAELYRAFVVCACRRFWSPKPII
jgi:hypothetical protein